MMISIEIFVLMLGGLSYGTFSMKQMRLPINIPLLSFNSSTNSIVSELRSRYEYYNEMALSKFKKLSLPRPDQQVVNLDKKFLDAIDVENDEAYDLFNKLSETANPSAKWVHVCDNLGVKVEKCSLKNSGKFIDIHDSAKGDKHACVRSTGIIAAPAEEVFKLFLDNTRVQEYNDHCVEVKDVLLFPNKLRDNWSKIAWARSPKYGVFKARDFCSVVNYRIHKDGSYQIINRPAYLSSHKPCNKFVRATILVAGNLIKPLGDGRCKLTMIAHVNPGGGADTAAAAWTINQLCAIGPPKFIRKLETAATKQSTTKDSS